MIDHILIANRYESLTVYETRKAICDDVFNYFEGIILKNKAKFQDFDAVAFIPLLKERFDEIKAGKLISDRK